MSKVLLSIAIPTYNRSLEIGKCLDMIADQMQGLTPESVEIVISDNASTDTTPDVVNDFIGNNHKLNVKYYRNSENIGVDKNCHVAIEKAVGDYVWLFCDDDTMFAGTINTVLNKVKAHNDCSFFFVNYQVHVGERIESSACRVETVKLVRGEDLFAQTRFAVSFASSCIFSKRHWLPLDHYKCVNTNWYHMYCLREMLPGTTALLLGTPLISMRGLPLKVKRDEKRNSDPGAIEFYMSAHLNFLDFAFSLVDFGYDELACQTAKKIAWSENLRQILYYQVSRCPYRINEKYLIFKRMTQYFSGKISYWLVCVPLLFIPSFISGRVYELAAPIYRYVKRHSRLA